MPAPRRISKPKSDKPPARRGGKPTRNVNPELLRQHKREQARKAKAVSDDIRPKPEKASASDVHLALSPRAAQVLLDAVSVYVRNYRPGGDPILDAIIAELKGE